MVDFEAPSGSNRVEGRRLAAVSAVRGVLVDVQVDARDEPPTTHLFFFFPPPRKRLRITPEKTRIAWPEEETTENAVLF